MRMLGRHEFARGSQKQEYKRMMQTANEVAQSIRKGFFYKKVFWQSEKKKCYNEVSELCGGNTGRAALVLQIDVLSKK